MQNSIQVVHFLSQYDIYASLKSDTVNRKIIEILIDELTRSYVESFRKFNFGMMMNFGSYEAEK